MDHHTGVIVAEVGFLLVLIGGVWLAAAEVPQVRFAAVGRSAGRGLALAVCFSSSPPTGVTSASQVRTRGNQLVAVARLASAISWALIVFRSFSGAVASSRPVIPVAERASSPAR